MANQFDIRIGLLAPLAVAARIKLGILGDWKSWKMGKISNFQSLFCHNLNTTQICSHKSLSCLVDGRTTSSFRISLWEPASATGWRRRVPRRHLYVTSHQRGDIYVEAAKAVREEKAG